MPTQGPGVLVSWSRVRPHFSPLSLLEGRAELSVKYSLRQALGPRLRQEPQMAWVFMQLIMRLLHREMGDRR